MANDPTLVEIGGRCDQRAIQRLALEDGSTLRSAAIRLARDTNEALDLVQDTLERAVRRAPALSQEELRRWTLAVMRNLWLDRLRHRRATREVRRQLELVLAEVGSEWRETALQSRDLNLDVNQWHKAVSKLDERLSCVLELQASNLSLAEIAERLQIPVSTVGTRLFRARAQVKRLLEAATDDADRSRNALK